MRHTRVVMGKTCPEDGVYRDVERPAVAPVAHSVQRRFRALRREASLRGLLVTLPDGDRSTSFRECDPDALEARRRKRLADEAAAKESAELATDASVLWRKWQRLLPTGAFLWRGEWRVPQSSSD